MLRKWWNLVKVVSANHEKRLAEKNVRRLADEDEDEDEYGYLAKYKLNKAWLVCKETSDEKIWPAVDYYMIRKAREDGSKTRIHTTAQRR